MDIANWDSSAWQAAAAWATVAVYLLILLYARKQVNEAKNLREAQARPFMVVDFDVISRRPHIYLTISNHGKTLARNVRFRFDPPLSSSLDDEHDALSNIRLLTEGTPTFAPGRTIPIVFDTFVSRGHERPDAYEVHITYDGEGGRRYEDKLMLDLGVYRNILYFTEYGISDVHDRLKEIGKILSRWGSSYGGLRTLSPDDERRLREERSKTREEREAAASNGADGGTLDPTGEE